MTKIEERVMAHVGAIYTVRQLFGATALKLYICIAALWMLGRLVWVERVFENFSNVGVGGALSFAASAILNTEIAVQATFVLFVAAGLWLCRDIAKLSNRTGARFA